MVEYFFRMCSNGEFGFVRAFAARLLVQSDHNPRLVREVLTARMRNRVRMVYRVGYFVEVVWVIEEIQDLFGCE